MAFTETKPEALKKVESKVTALIKNAPTDDSSSGFKNVADRFKKQQAERASLHDTLGQTNFKRLDEDDVRELGLKKGGKVSSASKRADGCAARGKTRGRMV
jgi:hypothetical protein